MPDKRLLIAFLAAALVVLCATPALADPEPYWPGSPDTPTDATAADGLDYNQNIEVVDLIGDTLSGSMKTTYLDNRNQAIADWNACAGSPTLAVGDDADAYHQKTITLYTDDSLPYAYGGWVKTGANGYGISAFPNQQSWRDRDTIAHELGHALGFGHTNIDSSVMGTADAHVGAIDCQGLARAWDVVYN